MTLMGVVATLTCARERRHGRRARRRRTYVDRRTVRKRSARRTRDARSDGVALAGRDDRAHQVLRAGIEANLRAVEESRALGGGDKGREGRRGAAELTQSADAREVQRLQVCGDGVLGVEIGGRQMQPDRIARDGIARIARDLDALCQVPVANDLVRVVDDAPGLEELRQVGRGRTARLTLLPALRPLLRKGP